MGHNLNHRGLKTPVVSFLSYPYNHRYPQSGGLSIQSPLGKSLVRSCYVVSANSIISRFLVLSSHISYGAGMALNSPR